MAELVNIENYCRERGFFGRVSAVHCSKSKWKNFSLSKKGQLHNKKERRLATNQVEAWYNYELHFWHWFPGRAGANNDKTMLLFSPLFNNILRGKVKFRLASKSCLLGFVSIRELLYFFWQTESTPTGPIPQTHAQPDKR